MERVTLDEPKRSIRDVLMGEDVRIYDFTNLYECEVGDGTRIGAFVEVQRGAVIGKRCKISSHTFICDGVRIEDGVFIGHGVLFINDRYPRATLDGRLQSPDDWTLVPTTVKEGATVGSGAVILCGITIGKNAMVGAGAVVTKDVPDGATVVGVPARLHYRTVSAEGKPVPAGTTTGHGTKE